MSSNIYSPPEAELNNAAENETINEFYVVSPGKFWLLFICTFGFYHLYWHYKHWSCYRQTHDDDSWPIARAIFSIFFTHALFNAIDYRMLADKKEYDWHPTLWATLYVITTLVYRLTDRVIAKDQLIAGWEILGLCMIPVLGFFLSRAQIAANIAVNDADGSSNNRLTGLNYLWMALGLVVWGLAFIGIFVAPA